MEDFETNFNRYFCGYASQSRIDTWLHDVAENLRRQLTPAQLLTFVEMLTISVALPLSVAFGIWHEG